MTSKVHSAGAEFAFALLVVAVIIVGVLMTVQSQDPHWLDRAGAAVAAIAAGAVLFQIMTEVKIEEERLVLTEQTHKAEELDATSPLGDLQARLLRKRMESIRASLTRARLRVAAYVVTSAMIGELLHGFGDLIACHLLIHCRASSI